MGKSGRKKQWNTLIFKIWLPGREFYREIIIKLKVKICQLIDFVNVGVQVLLPTESLMLY